VSLHKRVDRRSTYESATADSNRRQFVCLYEFVQGRHFDSHQHACLLARQWDSVAFALDECVDALLCAVGSHVYSFASA
jgi:hypothetical protein